MIGSCREVRRDDTEEAPHRERRTPRPLVEAEQLEAEGDRRERQLGAAEIVQVRRQKHAQATAHQSEQKQTSTSDAPTEALDPVCGMTVEIETARWIAERDGQTYYFCAPGCRKAFLAATV